MRPDRGAPTRAMEVMPGHPHAHVPATGPDSPTRNGVARVPSVPRGAQRPPGPRGVPTRQAPGTPHPWPAVSCGAGVMPHAPSPAGRGCPPRGMTPVHTGADRRWDTVPDARRPVGHTRSASPGQVGAPPAVARARCGSGPTSQGGHEGRVHTTAPPACGDPARAAATAGESQRPATSSAAGGRAGRARGEGDARHPRPPGARSWGTTPQGAGQIRYDARPVPIALHALHAISSSSGDPGGSRA